MPDTKLPYLANPKDLPENSARSFFSFYSRFDSQNGVEIED